MSSWLNALREACERTSQKAVGKRLRGNGSYPSDAIVNQALQGKYVGDIEKFRRVVEGAYLGVSVDCPVLGSLSLDQCISHQDAPYSPANSLRVLLYRTCRTCPNAIEHKES